MADFSVQSNGLLVSQMMPILNMNLSLSDYSGTFERLIITFLIFEHNDLGVRRDERKYHKRSERKFFMDIKVADYEAFREADALGALAILARETLRGVAKFLSKEKHFDHEKFLRDLEGIFRSERIL